MNKEPLINQIDEAPSKLAKAMMSYFGCACQYFPPMDDDEPIVEAYHCARREGTVPMLIAVDEILWECLILNSVPDGNIAVDYAFDSKAVAEYRKEQLSQPLNNGKELLNELLSIRKDEAEEDGFDWEEEIVGEMEGGNAYDRFISIWDHLSRKTHPLILAKIPVENPWEVFAYLPFGGWNECPDTLPLMAAAKYWYEQYGAIPCAMTHDELEFILTKAVPEDKAMELALEQYGFCPDMDQNYECIGMLSDTLRQSPVWYFWWD